MSLQKSEMAPHPILKSITADSMWDTAEPRALVNILPEGSITRIEETKARRPDLFLLDERTLRAKLSSESKRPTPTTGMLRLKFWYEYDRAQGAKSNMVAANIFGGICFQDHWLRAIENVHTLAWILCPPASYVSALEEGLVEGMARAREILEQNPIEDGMGKTLGRKVINIKLAVLQFQMLQYFDQRKYGSIVQKSEQKSLNVNVSSKTETSEKIASMVENMSEDELREKLERLQKEKPIIEVKAE
jgi:hypothetical protein